MSQTAIPYGEAFYTAIDPGARRSAEAVVPLVVSMLAPESVLDVGCGTGAWLDCFRGHGVRHTVGVDGPWCLPRDTAQHEFHSLDLRSEFSLDRRFDLVTSLEVAEHLPASSAEAFVRSLTRLGRHVLFSAAIPFQGGSDHVNEQWPEYWAEKFLSHGYVPLDCIRPKVWEVQDIEWWYAQNTLLYTSQEELRARPDLQRVAADTASRPLSVVHPRSYLAKCQAGGTRPAAAHFDVSTLMALAPRVMARAVATRIGRVWKRT